MFKSLHPALKVTLYCIAFTGIYLLAYFIKAPVYNEYEKLPHAIIGVLVALLLTWLFLKADGKTFRQIGLFWEGSQTLLRFVRGVLIGILLMGAMTLAVIFFSGFRIVLNPGSTIPGFLWASLSLLPLAFMEEFAFRAYPLETLKAKSGIRITIFLTAFLFGAYHLANGWTLQDSFLGAGVWGIIFGLAALWSGGIALPTGLHYAVNLTTSAFTVSTGSYQLFLLKSADGQSLENYQGSQLEVLLPAVCLLLTGLAAMEWYRRKKA